MANQDIEELMAVADQAIKEGDEATATQVMDYIESLQKAAPVSSGPNSRAATGPGSKPAPRVIIPGEFGAAIPTSREEQQEQFTAAGDLANVAARGAARTFIGGPGQLMSNVLPGMDENRFTQAYNDLETQALGPVKEGQEPVVTGAQMLAGLVGSPNKAGVFKAVPRTSIWSALRGGAGVGATSSASFYNEEAQGPKYRAIDAALGGAFGAALGSIAALPTGVQNIVKRLLDHPGDPRVVQDIATLNADPDWQEFVKTLSLGQRSGSVGLQNLEAQVAATKARQFFSNQLDNFYSLVKKGMGKAPQSQGEYVLGATVRDAYSNTRIANQKAASKAYGKTLDEALDLARSGDLPLPVDMNRTTEWFQQAGKFAKADVEQLLPNLPQRYRQVLEKWFMNVPGPMTATVDKFGGPTGVFRTSMEDMIALRRIGADMRSQIYRLGDSPQAQALARQGKALISAIDGDVDDFVRARDAARAKGVKIPDELEKAWDKFSIANAEYKAFKAADKELRNSAMGIIFGENAKVSSPEQAFNALLKAPPGEQVRFINTMNRVDPQIIRDIKSWKVQQVISSMRQQGERATSAGIDPQAFVNGLTDGDKIIGAHFWTKPELDHIQKVLAATRVIQEKATAFNRGLDIGGLAVAAATRSLAFLARPLTKIMGAPTLEALLFDPQALKHLQVMAATMNKPTATTIRAAGYISSLIEDAPKATEQPEEGQP